MRLATGGVRQLGRIDVRLVRQALAHIGGASPLVLLGLLVPAVLVLLLSFARRLGTRVVGVVFDCFVALG